MTNPILSTLLNSQRATFINCKRYLRLDILVSLLRYKCMNRIPFTFRVDFHTDDPVVWRNMFLEMSPEDKEMTTRNVRRENTLEGEKRKHLPPKLSKYQ